MKKINPRLEELASKVGNKELAERDRKIREEKERKKQEEELRKQKEHQKYITDLNKTIEIDLEKAIDIFVNHSNFPIIYNEANTISDPRYRVLYILKKAYEIGEEVGIHLGHIATTNQIKFKKALEEYGIYLLCPYFKTDENSLTGELCNIDIEEISSYCNGQHYLCNAFEDRSKKAAEGLIKLPEIKRPSLKKQIPKMKVNSVDLKDLDDWERVEGKYE